MAKDQKAKPTSQKSAQRVDLSKKNATKEKEETPKKIDLAEIGKVGAMAKLFEGSGYTNRELTLSKDDITATSVKMLLEGVDFDLVYTPLSHLGYKAVLAAIGPLYASLYSPTSLSVVLAVSKRFTYEQIEELWGGILYAAKEHKIESLNLDLNSSLTGMSITISAQGAMKQEFIENRQTAAANDLICITGNVGAAYMGLLILDREKTAFEGSYKEGVEVKQPDLSDYKYILQAYLRPYINPEILELFAQYEITPSGGHFLTRGLAGGINQFCAEKGLGAKIFLQNIPISSRTIQVSEEFNIEPTIAALNGGDDYKFIFTIPLEKHEEFRRDFQDYDIIGHMTAPESGTVLVTPEGAELGLKG